MQSNLKAYKVAGMESMKHQLKKNMLNVYTKLRENKPVGTQRPMPLPIMNTSRCNLQTEKAYLKAKFCQIKELY